MDEMSFYYNVEVDGLPVAGRFESVRDAYFMKLAADEDGHKCKVYCNGVDLTNNLLLMGSKRGWHLSIEIIG